MPGLALLTSPLLRWGLVLVVVAGGWLYIRALSAERDAAGQRAAVATAAARESAATADRLRADAERNAALATTAAAELERVRQETANVRTTIIRVPQGPDHCRDLLRAAVGGLPVRPADGAGGPLRGPTAAGPPRVAVPARP